MAPPLTDQQLDDKLDKIDYYALLTVTRNASPEMVREAFHRFALRFHPDQHLDDPTGRARALRIFKRGTEGYRVLLDPVLRARYDTALKRGEMRLTPEAERQSVVAEMRVAAAVERPLPDDVKPFYERAQAALQKGDLANAKAFLLLAARKTSHPRLQLLTKEILEAERAARLKR